MDILSLLVVIPMLTVFILFFVKDMQMVRIIAAAGMFVETIVTFFVTRNYVASRGSGDTSEFLMTKDFTWFESLNIHYFVGVDGIAVAMLLLTAIVLLAGIFISWNIEDLTREFYISLIILGTGVFGFFISLDLFTMFLFYEVAVIPMYLLIGIWGTGPKEYAAMKLTLMLMGASAMLLVAILGIYYFSGQTFNMQEIAHAHMPIVAQRFFFPMAFVGFGVLGALFPFHTWSPDGHASAPTAVSMLHAGVLMKLGTYGAFRVAMYLMPDAANEMSTFFMGLAAIGVIYGAFGAIRQTDLKYINAYSSVSHLGLIFFGMMALNKTAYTGAVLQMISHGLMTAVFFALIGMLYGRTHTRDVRKMGGLLKVLPFIAVVYMIIGMASLGLPGLSGFVAEMHIFVGAFQNPDTIHRIFSILAVSAIVVTAVYILRVVGMMLMGPIKHQEFEDLPKAVWYEKVGALLVLLPVMAIGLAPNWLVSLIQDSLAPIVEQLSHSGY